MLTNFDELKTLASREMNKSFPTEDKKCGVALVAKNGKIFTGHRPVLTAAPRNKKRSQPIDRDRLQAF